MIGKVTVQTKRVTSTDDTLIQSCSDPAAVTREELKDSTIYVVP